MIRTPAYGTEGRSHGVWLWIILIGVGSIALSRAFACATHSSTFRILRCMAEGVRKSLQEGGRDLDGLRAGPGHG